MLCTTQFDFSGPTVCVYDIWTFLCLLVNNTLHLSMFLHDLSSGPSLSKNMSGVARFSDNREYSPSTENLISPNVDFT